VVLDTGDCVGRKRFSSIADSRRRTALELTRIVDGRAEGDDGITRTVNRLTRRVRGLAPPHLSDCRET
jgi:hypothetical protein